MAQYGDHSLLFSHSVSQITRTGLIYNSSHLLCVPGTVLNVACINTLNLYPIGEENEVEKACVTRSRPHGNQYLT